MKLDELWPMRSELMFRLERWVNDGSPSGWTDGAHQVGEAFRPTGTRARIPVPTVQVHVDQCAWFGDRTDSGLEQLLRADGQVLCLPLHPDVPITPEAIPGPVLSAVPTSSARTVAWPDATRPTHLKLHYPGLLGRAPRELNRRRVRISVATSIELSRLRASGVLDARTDFLAEPVGVVHPSSIVYHENDEVGLLVRDTSPLTPRRAGLTVLPCFSLTSGDRLVSEDEPLLVQLIRQHGWNVDDFAEALIAPLLRSYFELALSFGIIPEMHGQNTLVEIDPDGRCTRVVHRDLLDMVCDPLVRAARRLPVPTGMRSRELSDTDGVYDWRSWAFDFKFAEYTLEPAVLLFAATTGIHTEKVRQVCANLAHREAEACGVPLRDYFLPWDCVRYLGDDIPDWSSGPTMRRRAGARYR